MVKGFLIKTVFLIIALAVVLAVIIVAAVVSRDTDAVETAYNRTFFEQFVLSGGPIVWFVLLPMSLLMVFFIIEYSLIIRRAKLLPEDISDDIIELVREHRPEGLQPYLEDEDDFVSISILQAVNKGKGDWFRMRSVMAESLQEQAMKLLRKIEWLNLIGNVSPMVGLFGTVYGMIKLFNAIVITGGQPQPAHLASGISVALVTTFWGLFIAIPALAIHSVFRNRIETLVSEAVVEAENVMPEIRKAVKIQSQRQLQKPKQMIQGLKAKSVKTVDKSLTQKNLY